MPYISQDYRKELIPLMDALADKINEIHNRHPEQTKDGLLNYSVTEILNKTFPDPRYTDFNEIIGFLECCKLEYYRKRAAGYEDKKEIENGAVRSFDKQINRGY